jgi:hypothetical protein
MILSKQTYFFIDWQTNNKLTTCFGSSELSSGLKQVLFRTQRPFLIGCYLKALLTSHIEQIHIKIVLILRLINVVYEECAFLGYYAASSGNFLPTFREIYRSHLQGSRMKKTGFLTDVSGWPIGPIFECLESKEAKQSLFGFLTVEDGTDKLSRNVGKKSNPFWILYPWRWYR